MDSRPLSPIAPFLPESSHRSPILSNDATISPHSHLRRRSSTSHSIHPLESALSPTESVFSNAETVVDVGEDYISHVYNTPKLGLFGAYKREGEEATKTEEASSLPSYKGDPEKKFPTKTVFEVAVLLGVALAGWIAGSTTLNTPESTGEKICRPYEQHGILITNVGKPAGNYWSPIAAPESCKPTDFTSLILESGYNTPSPEIDVVRNRTIVLFGDSVDRHHNKHFCEFVDGKFEMIGAEHSLSPPYPPGEELPPPGFKNKWNGRREWHNIDQSRPFICHVDHLNLRVLSVFHFGYRNNRDDWLLNNGHFYPPAKLEDRFDQILVPLVRSIATKYGTDPIPDLVSVSSGFWGLLRLSKEQEDKRQDALKAGANKVETWYRYDAFNNMDEEKRRWLEKRTKEVVKHVAKAWRSNEGVQTKPQFLWRTLHHVKETRSIPFNRAQSLNEISRSVIERVSEEARTLSDRSLGLKSWFGKGKSSKADSSEDAGLSEEDWMVGLHNRLRIDEWGSMILGQESRFMDDVHPKPLPASFLYANMLFQRLKEAAERWPARVFDD